MRNQRRRTLENGRGRPTAIATWVFWRFHSWQSSDICTYEKQKDLHNDQKSQLVTFARHGVLKNRMRCLCNALMVLVKDKSVLDGYRWWCSSCKKHFTIRRNSIFRWTRLSLMKAFTLLIHWLEKCTIKKTCEYLQITYKTVVNFHRHIRLVLEAVSIIFKNYHFRNNIPFTNG